MSVDHASVIENILDKIGLGTVAERFKKEKIDEKIALSLSDNELIRLGITTIGDRARFRDLCREETQEDGSSQTSGSTSTSRDGGSSSSGLHRSRNHRERALLFNSRRSQPVKKKEKMRTWTATFVCLADRLACKVPSSSEKQILQKAGLGIKRIKFEADDDERAVFEKITSSEKNGDTGEVIGFPKLKKSGGVELMNCIANCRDLNTLVCAWSVKSLRANIGGQSRIYLRPIQKSLCTKPVVEDTPSEITEKCNVCGEDVLLRNMRTHVFLCCESHIVKSSSEDEDEQATNRGTASQMNPHAQQEEGQSLTENGGHPPGEALYEQERDTTEMQDSNLEQPIESLACDIAKHCITNEIVNPVEILRYFQSKFVLGRQLDISNPEESCEGSTNFILVDRDNILATSFDEIKEISDLRRTLQVEFYGECAEDYGGPRKEFFRLALNAINDKYFEKGLRDHLAEEYEVIGIIMGLSILQNGKIPQFLSEEILRGIFDDQEPQPCIAYLRNGLAKLGIIQIVKQLPIMKHLFRQKEEALTVRKLVTILKPKFSEEGSNNLPLEKSIYAAFLKYIREVASGRRGSLSLGNILAFATGADQEPILGFCLPPSLNFADVSTTFLPTANTCTNSLNLPRPTRDIPLPNNENLFNLFDYAFVNTYFGNM